MIQNAAYEIPYERAASIGSDHSHSTFTEDVPDIEEVELKTPKVIPKVVDFPPIHHAPSTPPATSNHDHAAGPLEQQLLALLSKVTIIEQDRPTVMASDYEALQQRVKSLESEKAIFLRRQEALWHCRDEDLANLIKIRGELASLRRQHDGIMKLRDQDAENLLAVRDKLAKLTWATEKQQQDITLQRTTSFNATGRASARQSVGPGSDLWAVAKSAALEQRVLELESANAILRAELDKARSSTDSPRPLSRITTGEDGLEGSHHHRARLVARLATLRTENEMLRRDLARKEDENAEWEERLERLQRRSGILAL
jgi:predicted nuclease with TOPRIM domain